MYVQIHIIRNGVGISDTSIHDALVFSSEKAPGFISRDISHTAEGELQVTVKWNTIEDWYNFTKENATLYVDSLYDRNRNPAISNTTQIIIQHKYE